jgi:hypothetical protein
MTGRRGQRGRVARIAFSGLFALAMVNFAAFILIGLAIGGFAIHGGFTDRGYYLARSAYGMRTRVSESTFRYSRTHEHSLLITHPLAIVAGWLFYRRRRA